MIEIKKDSVTLSTGSNKQYDLPFLWLRDNCQCDECRIIETQEKQFLLHTVPVEISPTSVEIKDESLFVLWPDNHQSVIPLNQIEDSGKPRYPEHKLWTSDFTPRRFDWSEFLDNEDIALEALKTFVSFGVIILNNAPKVPDSVELLSKRFGPIHETLFERIHNVSVTGHVYSVAHTSKGLSPHNDFASYRAQPSVGSLHVRK